MMYVFMNKFSVSDRLKSIGHALDGLKNMYYEEHNFRIHLLILVAVILASFFFQIAVYEWLAIVLAAGLVFSLEILNTSIETLADFVTVERNESIKKIKDLSAAGVLISAFIAVLVGLIIFLPRVIALI